MAITEQQIKELKDYYVKDLYSGVRKEQEIDQKYIDDTFPTKIKPPHQVYRSGFGYVMVNAPAEHIITQNPQAHIEVLKGKGDKTEDIKDRLGATANSWLEYHKRQNPNPAKEYVKNTLQRGEAYIKICLNEYFEGGLTEQPVYFIIPEPMVCYGSPEEDEYGIPTRMLIVYPRQVSDLILHYPNWTNPHHRGETTKRNSQVEWVEYYDKESRYWEADGEPIFPEGIQENILGFTPFVRQYSGFGKRSPEGKLESLIVGDLRMSRGLLLEECTYRSDLASIITTFAHKPKTVMSPGEVNKASFKDTSWNAYDVNIFENVPPGTTINDEWGNVQPSPEMFRQHEKAKADLAQRCPYLVYGMAIGASGRQDDMALQNANRRYDTIVENTEQAFAIAIEKGFEACKIPGQKPAGLHNGDLDTTFKVKVFLKAKDPVEDDRKVTLGSRLYQAGEISPITNLVEFKGYTPEKAKQEMVNIMKWKVIMNSPDILAFIGKKAVEESGMGEELSMLEGERAQLEQGQSMNQLSPTENQRLAGEVQTQTGVEMPELSEESKGARNPPVRYQRGG